MATAAEWLEGARPRTLPAAVAPVLAGTGAAAFENDARPLLAVLALIVSLALQVGVNYANDYSDGVRGTDAARVGPLRLVGSGAASPQAVKAAAFASFAVAAVAGLVLSLLSAPWLVVIGAAAIAAAWFYTGGSRPYGYRGLGEVGVFVFFGLVAVLGTTYTQALRLSWVALAGAVGVGAWACAILVANNLRDIPSDRESGKVTLAVRLGDAGTRRLYSGLVLVALLCGLVVIPSAPWAAISVVAVLLVLPALRVLHAGTVGLGLIPVLRDTGRAELLWSLLWAIGVLASR
ncbi:MAG: 1,4-dihydroxy-2-naphthoate polyprenyltransferase [Actinomycetes bacterium]